MALKSNLSPRSSALRARLILIFVISQVVSIAIAYMLANKLIKPAPSNADVRLILTILFYSVLIFVDMIWLMVLAFRPLKLVEHYFAARKAGITLSNNLIHESISEKLIDDILNQESSIPKNQDGQPADNNIMSQLALDMSSVGVIALDSSSRPIMSNLAASEILGCTKDDMQAISHKIAQMRFAQATSLAQWVAECEKGKIHAHKFWNRVVIKVVVDEQELTRFVDISASYAKREGIPISVTLVIADRTADYSEEDKSLDFIAVAAHELRGPITVLRGLIDILSKELGPNLQADQIQILQRMEVSAKQLTNYVNNILSVAHIDQDNLQTTLRRENWADLLTQICSNLSAQVQARGRHLQLSLPNNLPDVSVDRVGIEHIITNLVDNATKYSHDGGIITISSQLVNGMVETNVQDNGIGIPESIIGHLFTKFYRSHRSKQAISGSGIGLFLCKNIINAHKGEIWVKSQEGKGTTIGFTVPTNQKLANNTTTSDNGDNINRGTHGWIKNHSLYRR